MSESYSYRLYNVSRTRPAETMVSRKGIKLVPGTSGTLVGGDMLIIPLAATTGYFRYSGCPTCTSLRVAEVDFPIVDVDRFSPESAARAPV